ncbi:hypothetical protein [Thermosphaera sp.]|uniref:Uncharacterized protein n=1 Tax=Thermosphaera aggregans TaxID=54254 RepID=A0A7C2BKV0_9CREN
MEDKIVLLRFVAGISYGFLIYLLGLLRIVSLNNLNTFAWTGAAVLYAVTIFLTYRFFKPSKAFNLYLRGLLTFYTSWLLTSYVLNDLYSIM